MRNVPALIEMFEADLKRVQSYKQTKRVKQAAADLIKHIAELHRELEALR